MSTSDTHRCRAKTSLMTYIDVRHCSSSTLEEFGLWDSQPRERGVGIPSTTRVCFFIPLGFCGRASELMADLIYDDRWQGGTLLPFRVVCPFFFLEFNSGTFVLVPVIANGVLYIFIASDGKVRDVSIFTLNSLNTSSLNFTRTSYNALQSRRQ